MLRVSIGAIMIFSNGPSKLLSPGPFIEHRAKEGIPLPTMTGYPAILAETIFPLLIMLGIFTRISVLIEAVNMLVAAFVYTAPH